MKLVIVADDSRICVDGLCFDDLDVSSLDASIHAVQWNGQWGEIEYKSVFQDGKTVKIPNQVITDVTPYQWAVDVWNVAKASYDAAVAAALSEAQAAEASGQTAS